MFIVDDSLFSRTSCKKTELGSKVFDHTDMHFKKGFRMLTLSWSDGNTLIPVNSCLLASAKEANIIGPVKNFDNRTIAGKRRKLAQTKAPEAMMALLDTALSAGLKADYVLFDSWFSNPAQITAIHSKGMDVIAMLKKSSRIKYSYCGEAGLKLAGEELKTIFGGLGNEIKGCIWGERVWQKGEVEGTKAMEEAYQAGRRA